VQAVDAAPGLFGQAEGGAQRGGGGDRLGGLGAKEGEEAGEQGRIEVRDEAGVEEVVGEDPAGAREEGALPAVGIGGEAEVGGDRAHRVAAAPDGVGVD
jgi:hypothetical protein